MTSNGVANGLSERDYGHTPTTVQMAHMVASQLESYSRFETEYLKELFAEISPIQDFTGKNLELHFEVPKDPLIHQSTTKRNAGIKTEPSKLRYV